MFAELSKFAEIFNIVRDLAGLRFKQRPKCGNTSWKDIYCKLMRNREYDKIETMKFNKLHVSFHAFSYYASLGKLFHRQNRHALASLVHASRSGVSSNFSCP